MLYLIPTPDLDKKMRMKMDALDYTIEEMLSIKYEDGRQRLVAYLSKLLNETKYSYEICNKEILAVIRGLEAWRHLLEDAKFKFEV